MSIYSASPQRHMLSEELQKLLWRNGMKDAWLGYDASGRPQLTVQGMDSPVMTYTITAQQAKAMTQGGYNSLNRKAYETFCQIVGKDFDMPQYMSARASHSLVNMGQDGYRLGAGEYGMPHSFRNRPYFPRHHGILGVFDDLFGRPAYYHNRYAGFPLRRVNDHLFYQNGGPLVAERPDGSLRPGELKSGTNGIYWKGTYPGQASQQGNSSTLDVGNVSLLEPWYNHKGTTVVYNDVINKEHPFTLQSWKQVLKTHGFDIDEKTNTMKVRTLQLRGVDQINLTPAEVQTLLAPTLPSKTKGKNDNGLSIQTRLDLLNSILSKNYENPNITLDTLYTKDYVSIVPKEDIRAKVDELFIEQDKRLSAQETTSAQNVVHPEQREYKTGFIDKENSIPVMDGRALDADHGWYLPIKGGKAVTVGEIIAYPAGTPGKETTFKMSAVINGEIYTHDIDQRTYLNFVNQNDEARLKLFDRAFDEVSIKHKQDGDGIQYAPPSKNLGQATNAAEFNGRYSLLWSNEAYIITGATAWKDKVSGDYVLNVRESGDIGMWQFHMTEDQFNAFKKGDDAKKAEIIGQVGNFVDKAGHSYSVVPDSSLTAFGVKLGTQGIADKQFINDVLANDPNGVYHELLSSDQMTQEQLDRLRAQANGTLKDSLTGTRGDTYVNGQSQEGKMAGRMWVRSGKDGRATDVTDITVQQLADANGKLIPGKYQMSAVIDGNVISHNITEKELIKFRSVNDYEKLKLFDKIFDEVKLKHIPGTGGGTKLGVWLAAAATVVLGGAMYYDAMRHRPHDPASHDTGGFFYNNNIPGSTYGEQMRDIANIRFQQAIENGDQPRTALNLGR